MYRDSLQETHETLRDWKKGSVLLLTKMAKKGEHGTLYKIFPGLLTRQENRISSWGYTDINKFVGLLEVWFGFSKTGTGKLWPVDQIHPAVCFCNKVLLEHNHAHWFTIYDWLCSTVAELNSCNRDHLTSSIENFLSDPLQKMFADLCYARFRFPSVLQPLNII